jgi:hypothetical protein
MNVDFQYLSGENPGPPLREEFIRDRSRSGLRRRPIEERRKGGGRAGELIEGPQTKILKLLLL